MLASYLTLYLAILLGSMVVIVVIEMMLNFDDALEFRQGVQGIASYLFLRMPSYYLPYLLPVSSFAAGFLCAGIPARAQEILATKAGGIAPQRIFVPVLAAAAVLSGLMLLLNETLVLETGSRFEQVEEGDASELFPSNGSFWYHRGPHLYNVQEADRATSTVTGVRVYERTPGGRLLRSVQAASAVVGADHRWHLRDAVIRRFDPDDPGAPPEVVRADATVLEVASERELALLDANPRALSLPRLREYIHALAREGRDPTRYEALFQSRLAEPFTVLVFALLGLPLGLAVERSRSLAAAAVQGVALVGAFYAMQATGTIVASGGVAAAVPAPWILLLVFATFGLWRFARMAA